MQQALASSAKLAEAARQDRAELTAFYEARKGEPLWVTAAGVNARARAVLAELGRAEEWGLKAADFDLPTLALDGLGEGRAAPGSRRPKRSCRLPC